MKRTTGVRLPWRWPWPHPRVSWQNGGKAGPSARSNRIRGKQSCPLRGAAVTWRKETRSAEEHSVPSRLVACTARLNDLHFTGEHTPGWQPFSRDEPSTSSRRRFALNQIVGNRRKLRSRFNSGTLPQTTKSRPLPQRGRTSETIADFWVAFPPGLSTCDECSRCGRFLLLKACESLPENQSLCTKNAAKGQPPASSFQPLLRVGIWVPPSLCLTASGVLHAPQAQRVGSCAARRIPLLVNPSAGDWKLLLRALHHALRSNARGQE